MMGGGKKNKIRVRRLVSSYAISVVHIGANGHGQIAKMINQICITGIIQSLAEALSFGRAKQVDMRKQSQMGQLNHGRWIIAQYLWLREVLTLALHWI